MDLRGALLVGALPVAGCVKETRPLPILQATQATAEIPADQLLDVGVHILDPGVPKEVEDDPDMADKLRIYPDIRNAEARYIAMELRNTLEDTGHWGTARVVPTTVNSFDMTVDGKIIESNGARLKLEITARDATGKLWIDKKEYEGVADTRTYRDGYNAGRDPFENVYVLIANDLLAARNAPPAGRGREHPQGQRDAFRRGLRAGRLQPVPRAEQEDGRVQGAAPAGGGRRAGAADQADPRARLRHDRHRQRELRGLQRAPRGAVFELAPLRLRRDHGRRKAEGAGAQSHDHGRGRGRRAAIFVPDSCQGGTTCQRATDAARYGGVAGGVAAVISGYRKNEEAKIHTDSLKEISGSFQTEAAPLVVDVEGRTLRLTGTAEEQYAEWRRLLHELYKGRDGARAHDPAGAARRRHDDANRAIERRGLIPYEGS